MALVLLTEPGLDILRLRELRGNLGVFGSLVVPVVSLGVSEAVFGVGASLGSVPASAGELRIERLHPSESVFAELRR